MFTAFYHATFPHRAVWMVLLSGLFLPTFALGHLTPGPALQAHQMLEGVWSQAIELTNSNSESDYPATVYATVFEFDGMLWFYTGLGTQPISGTRDKVSAHRENLLPLLQNTVERGFQTLQVLSPPKPAETAYPELERGCVIESLYALEQLRRDGTELREAKLLFYSVPRGSLQGIRGHAILVFETAGGHFYINPPELDVVQPLTETLRAGAVAVASVVEANSGSANILEAFFLPLEEAEAPLSTAELYAGDG